MSAARPPARPTTAPERALVARVVRGQRRAVASFAACLAGVGVVLFVLIWPGAGASERLAVALGCAVPVAMGAGVWALYRRVQTVPREAGTAVALQGEVSLGSDGQARRDGYRQAAVGGQPVAVPPHWRGYLAPGERRTVWAVETNRLPLAVATDDGPSADADARIRDADPPGRALSLGALAAVFGLWVQALGVIGWAWASGGEPAVVLAASAVLVGVGVVVLTRAERGRLRLHAAYAAAGVRHAQLPESRRARALRRGAQGAALFALAGVAVAALTSLPTPLAIALVTVLGLLGWFQAAATADPFPEPVSSNPPAT